MFLGLDIVKWIQIISAIGTLLAAIAAWKSSNAAKDSSKIAENQLDELKKQRIKMYEPSLIFTDNSYEIRKNKKIEQPYFSLYNIGFGAAKDIQIKWKEMEYLDYNHAPFTLNDQGEQFIRVQLPFNDGEVLINRELDRIQEIKHLLPTSIEKNPINIQIPMIANYSLMYNIFNRFMENVEELGSTIYVYKLSFTVMYKDMDNVEYTESKELEFGVSSFSRENNEGRFYIKVSN